MFEGMRLTKIVRGRGLLECRDEKVVCAGMDRILISLTWTNIIVILRVT